MILATGHAADGGETILKALLERADNNAKHRHYLSLLAVSCLETATAFSDEISQAIQNRLAELVPPKNVAEAKALASAGEIALAYLDGHSRAKAPHVVACVRALALIGTEAALPILARYTSSHSITVSEELLRARDHFEPAEYDRQVLSKMTSATVRSSAAEIAGLARMTALRSLNMSHCRAVTDLSPLAGMSALQSLDLTWCRGVTDLGPLAGLTALQSLNISGCAGVTDLGPIAGLTALQSLNISGCAGVTDLGPIAGLTALQSLNLRECSGVTDLGPLADLKALRALVLESCSGVTDLGPLAGLTALQSLNLWNSGAVTDLGPLAGLTALQSLNLLQCEGVTDLAPLAGLAALRVLQVDNTELRTSAPPNLRRRFRWS